MQAPRILAMMLLLPLAATAAFMVVEGWSFFDSLYMAVITLTTVGFHEVHPLSDGGRIVVIVYLVSGIGVFLFGAAWVGELVLRAPLKQLRIKRHMESALESIRDHVVVCGYGRIGRRLCTELSAAGLPVVVIDREEAAVAEIQEQGWLAVRGDATSDASLEAAAVSRARGLATVLPSDADNLYVVLSARILNPELQIVSRSTDERSVTKLERAGANRIVSLYETGAMRMAQLLTNPKVVDFLQILTNQGDRLELAEINVSEEEGYCRKQLDQTDFRDRGIIIVGLQKASGDMLIAPPSSAVIEPGDKLMAFGEAESIAKLLAAD